MKKIKVKNYCHEITKTGLSSIAVSCSNNNMKPIATKIIK